MKALSLRIKKVMANDNVLQKKVKCHDQGHMFKIYGSARKVLSKGTNMPNMKALSLLGLTRHVFVKHGCPRWQQSQTIAKISKSYILTTPCPQGHVMSVKCKQPLDELKVQVWLLYDHPNFKYCTLFISGTELRTDGRTDEQTIQTLDAHGGHFRPGA